jgi:hypothetical protein
LAARCFALAARPFARATRASCWRFDFASAASFLSRAFSWALYFFTSFFVLPAMPLKARASFFFSRVSAIWSRVFSLATSSGRRSPSSFLPFAVAAAAVFVLSVGAFDALAAGAGAALPFAGAGAALLFAGAAAGAFVEALPLAGAGAGAATGAAAFAAARAARAWAASAALAAALASWAAAAACGENQPVS